MKISMVTTAAVLAMATGCAVDAGDLPHDEASGAAQQAMCIKGPVSPSVIGTLTPPPGAPGVPGAAVTGFAPPGYQTTNCEGRYEIQANQPATLPPSTATSGVTFAATSDWTKLPTTLQGCSAVHLDYTVLGLSKLTGTWTSIWSGSASGVYSAGTCHVAGTFHLPTDHTAFFSSFRVSGDAYFKPVGSSALYEPIFLEARMVP